MAFKDAKQFKKSSGDAPEKGAPSKGFNKAKKNAKKKCGKC